MAKPSREGAAGSAARAGRAPSLHRPSVRPEDPGLLLAPEDAQRAYGQGLHLVLARHDGHGGDEAHALRDPAREPLRVGHAAGHDDRVDLAHEDGGHLAYALGDLVGHGLEDSLRFPVARVDPALDLDRAVRAEVGDEAALAALEGEGAVDPFLPDELEEGHGGQVACPLGGEGAVLGGNHVDEAAPAVRVDGDAAAEMGGDEVQVLVALPLLVSIPDAHGAGVEGMAEAWPRELPGARETREVLELVDGHAVVDVAGKADCARELVGDHRGKVRGVELAGPVAKGVEHRVVHDIGAGLYWREYAAPRDDAGEVTDRHVVRFEEGPDRGSAHGKLVVDVGEFRHVLGLVLDGFAAALGVAVEEGDLGGSRAGIDDEDELVVAFSVHARLPSYPVFIVSSFYGSLPRRHAGQGSGRRLRPLAQGEDHPERDREEGGDNHAVFRRQKEADRVGRYPEERDGLPDHEAEEAPPVHLLHRLPEADPGQLPVGAASLAELLLDPGVADPVPRHEDGTEGQVHGGAREEGDKEGPHPALADDKEALGRGALHARVEEGEHEDDEEAHDAPDEGPGKEARGPGPAPLGQADYEEFAHRGKDGEFREAHEVGVPRGQVEYHLRGGRNGKEGDNGRDGRAPDEIAFLQSGPPWVRRAAAGRGPRSPRRRVCSLLVGIGGGEAGHGEGVDLGRGVVRPRDEDDGTEGSEHHAGHPRTGITHEELAHDVAGLDRGHDEEVGVARYPALETLALRGLGGGGHVEGYGPLDDAGGEGACLPVLHEGGRVNRGPDLGVNLLVRGEYGHLGLGDAEAVEGAHRVPDDLPLLLELRSDDHAAVAREDELGLARDLEGGEVRKEAASPEALLLVEGGPEEVARVECALHEEVGLARADEAGCLEGGGGPVRDVDDARGSRKARLPGLGQDALAIAHEDGVGEAEGCGIAHRLDHLRVVSRPDGDGLPAKRKGALHEGLEIPYHAVLLNAARAAVTIDSCVLFSGFIGRTRILHRKDLEVPLAQVPHPVGEPLGVRNEGPGTGLHGIISQIETSEAFHHEILHVDGRDVRLHEAARRDVDMHDHGLGRAVDDARHDA